MRNIFITIILCVVGVMTAHAQIFKYIGMEDGLCSRRVLALEQDEKGYIWILTHKGADRYDGLTFTNFKLRKGDKDVNFYPDLNTMDADVYGTLWEYGKDGLVFRFDDIREEFRLVFDLTAKYPETAGYPVTAVYFDKRETMWFCSNRMTIIYNTRTGQDRKVWESVEDSPVSSITSDGDGVYWFSGLKAIRRVTLEKKGADMVETKVDVDSQITYIYYHVGSGKLIVNTLFDGLLTIDTRTGVQTPLKSQLKDIGVNTVKPVPGRDDEVLIATDGDGVYKLNTTSGELSRYLMEDTDSPGKMNGSIVKDLYIDREGRIWCAIYPTGITVYTEKYPQYQWLRHNGKGNSLSDDRVNAILEDSEGDIWFGTCNGISCLHTKTGRWQNFMAEARDDTPCRNRIFISLYEYEPGKILAGGYMAGAYVIDKKTGTVDRSTLAGTEREYSPDKYIRSIIACGGDDIWAGGYHNLTSFSMHSRNLRQVSTIFPIMHLKERDGRSLWVGTINGLYIFDKVTGEFHVAYEDSQMGCVNTIHISQCGCKAYVGTYGNGLFVIDNRTGSIEHFHKDNCGLENNNVYSILQNEEGDLFLGTENGLTLFEVKERRFTNWTKEEGLLAASFNQNAAVMTRSGMMIFGTNEGAVIISGNTRYKEDFTSHIIFSNLNIMYRAVHPMEEDSPLSKPLDETDRIVLDYDQNTFSLNVSSINFDNPASLWYSWKLEGFFNEWSTPSDFKLIRYTNLSPGSYTLCVRAILMSDNSIVEERSIRIFVRRPFWLSVWAFLIYGLIVICLFYAWMRYMLILRIRKASAEKISFFINTAHDIRTPLTLVKAPLAEILKNEKLSEQGLVNINLAIQNTDNLSALANNLMNFQKEELYSSKASVKREDLDEYMQGMLGQFRNYAKQKGIVLTYRNEAGRMEVWIDRNKMDSILRNLLSNAMKYTPRDGSVTVRVGRTKSRWLVDVSDTGIGIPKRDQRKLFRLLFRGSNATNQLITGAGVGMLLTYRLIKNHQGRISFSSAENAGTRFHLSFPFESKKYFVNEEVGDTPSPVIMAQVTPHIEGQTALPVRAQVSEDAPLILIVEDNQSLRTFLMQSLSDAYNVDEAANGEEAMEHIRKRQPDLVLSDVMMPVMNGEDLCVALKSNVETSHIAVILLTALGDQEDILRGLGARADLYIVKPFDLIVLRANIINLLENRRLLREKMRKAAVSPDVADTPAEMPSSLDEDFIRRVDSFVLEHVGDGLTVDDVCSHISMSRTSFYNKMKALTGIAPNEYIRNVRMRHAARLLRSQRYTVAEVADMTGFADPKYFTDTFKKFFGKTPSEYKKRVES